MTKFMCDARKSVIPGLQLAVVSQYFTKQCLNA